MDLLEKISLKVRIKKDFRAENGKLVETNPKEAKKLWETAKKELGTDKIELEFLNFDNEDAKKGW